jgi:hypothetical protein
MPRRIVRGVCPGLYGDRVVFGRKEGEAFIEVVSDTDRYERDLERSIERATKAAARSDKFEALTKAMGKAGDDGADEFSVHFIRELRHRRPDLVREVERIGERAGSGFVEIFTGEIFRRNGGLFGGRNGISRLFAGSVGQLGDAFNLIKEGASSAGGFLAVMSKWLIIIPLVTAVIIGLGNSLFALIGIVGAIPALALGLVATLAPLLLIFEGMGEAISALTSGDLEKFNESLKKLTPSAAGVLREFKSLMPLFSSIRKSVQEAFFGRISGDFTRLLRAVSGPLLAGLSNVAFALGSIVSQLLRFLASKRAVEFLANLFGSVADGLNRNGPTLIAFIDALFTLANASLPAVSAFLDRLSDATNGFATFIQESVNDGSFQAFLDDAFSTLTDIWDFTKQVLGLFKDLFSTTDEKGQTFLQDVTEAVKKLREFFQSDDGKRFINDMLTAGHDLVTILDFIVADMDALLAVLSPTTTAVHLLAQAFDDLRDRSSWLNKVATVWSPFLPFLLPRFAKGGITDGPTLAMVGDNPGGREAVIPLDDPARAREIARDPQVTAVLGDPQMTVYAVFDGEPFQARIVKTVRETNRATATKVGQQPRMVG